MLPCERCGIKVALDLGFGTGATDHELKTISCRPAMHSKSPVNNVLLKASSRERRAATW